MKTQETVTIPVETVGQAYLEILRARGIKYFFGNSGTDFGPIIDALAKLAADKKEFPRPITVAHEFVAVSMAQGYAMITGEPQVVMVHVIVGTGNASAAVMNASRLNVPMIFSAGRTPLTEEGLTGSRSNFIHWGQESFDQGSLLREFTRWDYELRNGLQVEAVVDRALEMTLGTPQGPVYLTLPPNESYWNFRNPPFWIEKSAFTCGVAAEPCAVSDVTAAVAFRSSDRRPSARMRATSSVIANGLGR